MSSQCRCQCRWLVVLWLMAFQLSTPFTMAQVMTSSSAISTRNAATRRMQAPTPTRKVNETLAPGQVKFCPTLNNMQAPRVPTLMMSKDNNSISLVVSPDCTVKSIKAQIVDNILWLRAGSLGIMEVESYSPVDRLDLSGNSISARDFSSDTKLVHLILASNFVTSTTQFKYPPNLMELDFEDSRLTELNASLIPSNLTYLDMGFNALTSLEKFDFPKPLIFLDLYANNLSSLDTFVVPPKLRSLFLHQNRFEVLENYVFPPTIQEIKLGVNPLKTIRGVVFPANLTLLDLKETDLQEFEIRESDIPMMQTAQVMLAHPRPQVTCSDPAAKKQVVKGIEFCVISDNQFLTKYASKLKGSPLPSPSQSSSSSSSTWIIIIIGVAGVLVVCLAAVGFVWRRRANSKQTISKDHPGAEPMVDVEVTADVLGDLEELTLLENDIRNDDHLLAFHVPSSEIKWVQQIAVGGFGIVYLATCRGNQVAVKQILPEKAKEKQALDDFMDEIRLCSTLAHPKIVKFVGVSWSTLLDLSFLLEYMPNGDLRTLLQRMRDQPRSAFDWFTSSPGVDAPCKTRIALDVAEALVYLHGFQKPILHRDLKSRNVLFSVGWDAKISDFGVSREKALGVLDETNTMTAEIGTVAWTAPEVLQGERYNEKSDVYSFGVILSELDTCRLPYKNLPEIGATGNMTRTRIAMLVSSGTLRPEIKETCPAQIRELALACLRFNAADRPSSSEILEQLGHAQGSNY